MCACGQKRSFLIDDILAPTQPPPPPRRPRPRHAHQPHPYSLYTQHYGPLLPHAGDVFPHGWWHGACSAVNVAGASGCTARRKGGQVRFTARQSAALEQRFASDKYLSPDTRRALAAALALSDRQVKTWFQNRRAKWRRATAPDADDGSPGDGGNSDSPEGGADRESPADGSVDDDDEELDVTGLTEEHSKNIQSRNSGGYYPHS